MRVFLPFVLALCLTATATARRYAPTPPIIGQANAWKPGQPIPEGLLHTSGPPDGVPPLPPARRPDGTETIIFGDPLPNPTDSLWIFAFITNYPLLREVVFATRDEYIRKLAVEQALLTGGPNRFFADVKAGYAAHPGWLSKPPMRALRRRADHPLAILVKMYADEDQVPPETARAVFADLAAHLNKVGSSDEKAAERAIWKCQRKYRKPDGLSRIGDEGYVILTQPSFDRDSPGKDLPAPLVRRLLSARTGATFIERGTDPVYRQKPATTFYWIKEAYAPGQPGKPTT